MKKVVTKLGGKEPPYSGPRAYDIIFAFKHCIETTGVTNAPNDLASDRDKEPAHASRVSRTSRESRATSR